VVQPEAQVGKWGVYQNADEAPFITRTSTDLDRLRPPIAAFTRRWDAERYLSKLIKAWMQEQREVHRQEQDRIATGEVTVQYGVFGSYSYSAVRVAKSYDGGETWEPRQEEKPIRIYPDYASARNDAMDLNEARHDTGLVDRGMDLREGHGASQKARYWIRFAVISILFVLTIIVVADVIHSLLH
jgi:hypothetical protein